MSKCKTCNGDGYTAEHAGDLSCREDNHYGCPVQVPCVDCFGTGKIKVKPTTKSKGSDA